jgi:hypothetical protein
LLKAQALRTEGRPHPSASTSLKLLMEVIVTCTIPFCLLCSWMLDWLNVSDNCVAGAGVTATIDFAELEAA